MLWIALTGFLTSLLSVYLVLHFSDHLGLMDVPNQRSSHQEPMPRGGGLGIILALCVSLTLYIAMGYWGTDQRALIGLIAGILTIGFIGFLDDLRNLPLIVRLVSQLLAATIAVVGIGPLRSIYFPLLGELRFGALAVPVSLLWIIGVTNIYNFMDGIDGLAGGEGVLGGVFIACIGGIAGNTQISAVGLFVAAASLGFLLFNFPPAKIFMGDSGSTTLGFTLAVIAILGSQSEVNPIPFLVFVLLLSNFLFDATFTLLKRIVRRESWYQAHNEHYYQLAVRSGHSHRRVTLWEYAIVLLLGGSSILYFLGKDSVRLTILIVWLTIFTSLGIWLGVSLTSRTGSESVGSDNISNV